MFAPFPYLTAALQLAYFLIGFRFLLLTLRDSLPFFRSLYPLALTSRLLPLQNLSFPQRKLTAHLVCSFFAPRL